MIQLIDNEIAGRQWYNWKTSN